jgi:hypothetical protein
MEPAMTARPAHLFPDNTDLARALLAEGERIATLMEAQIAEVANILGVCQKCGGLRREDRGPEIYFLGVQR